MGLQTQLMMRVLLLSNIESLHLPELAGPASLSVNQMRHSEGMMLQNNQSENGTRYFEETQRT